MKELSVFIDESGDFGEITERPAYYLVTLLFHDQKNDIASNVKKLEDSTKNSGFDFEYIHTGPVIRREDVFSGLSIDERRKLLFKMLNFIVSSPIAYEMAVVNRKEAPDKISLSGRLGREISNVIVKHKTFFDGIVSVDDDSLSMSNGLTDVFIDYLLLSGSQLAKSESEKRMVVFLAEKQQSKVGIGAVGFDIIEMPWERESFETDKAFMPEMIHHARNLSLEKSAWEILGYEPEQKYLHGVLLSVFGCKLCNDGM